MSSVVFDIDEFLARFPHIQNAVTAGKITQIQSQQYMTALHNGWVLMTVIHSIRMTQTKAFTHEKMFCTWQPVTWSHWNCGQ